MPTYEYECSGCREAYDVLQRMSDPVLNTCIKCGNGDVKKKLSVPTLLLRRAQPRSEGRNGVTVDAVPPDFSHPTLGVFALGVPDVGG